MADRNCFVLLQNRTDSEYNDFLGKFYHFPKKYLNQLSKPGIEFVYYTPSFRGEGVYFGYGKIKNIFADKHQENHYFAEIDGYRPFSTPVPFLTEAGKKRETGPGYNPQNSVREISPELLEELCLDGGIVLNFTADAHLIKVLGEQLIASEKVGVLELIKNAYDAQASYCTVRVEKIPNMPAAALKSDFDDLEGPVIVVDDDGDGMSWEAIERGWLRPASTLKTNIKERIKEERKKALERNAIGTYDTLVAQLKKAHKGRIPLGEKGVGRFATHRLGKKLKLTTKLKGQNYEYVLEIDWDKFDEISHEGIDLESVGVKLTRQTPSRDYGDRDSGTRLVIYGGKNDFSWTPDAIKDLNSAILSLNSPYPEHPKKAKRPAAAGFHATLECPQLADLPKEQFLSGYPPVFIFDGIVDETGVLDYTLKFSPPKDVPMGDTTEEQKDLDLKTLAKEKWSGRNPSCGPFYMHLEVWYRAEPWVKGPDKKNFIGYLSEFGGIALYRDHLNIFPAEKGTLSDWLELSQRHIKQGFRLSYYNMIGNIELSQTANIGLQDKTDREGLIENEAFRDFRLLVQSIVESVVERQFIGKRDEYNSIGIGIEKDPAKLGAYAKQGTLLTGNILKHYPYAEDPHKLLEGMSPGPDRKAFLVNLNASLKDLQKSLELMEEAKDLLSEQAGFGLAIAVSVHEMAKMATNFYMGISSLVKSGHLDKEKLKELEDSSKSFRNELARLGPLRAIKNEKLATFKISKAIRFASEIFSERMGKLGIKFVIDPKEDFTVVARYGAVSQIFTNLLDNSCYWLDTVTRGDKKILVKLDSDNRTVLFADNGPGIAEQIGRYLFQPGYSMRVPASGLGLYICKYYMNELKGDIYQTPRKDREADFIGAQFTLDFHRAKGE